MKYNPFRRLTAFEWALWLISLTVVGGAFLLVEDKDYLTLIASLVGVTALIFVAKGHALGQFLSIVFAVFYGIISFVFGYYGEVITYLCMTAPIAFLSLVSWLKHPYQDTDEVAVAHLKGKQVAIMGIWTVLVTVLFYFILGALGTENLLVSTVSVTTSFLACYMTYLRSPYYALAYAANDGVLIVLWILATLDTPGYFPMILCFVMFLINDLYGFFNWRRMERRQSK